MYCSKCGSKIKDGANFCFKCGNKSTNQSIGSTQKISTIPLNTASTKINTSKEINTSNNINNSNKINTKPFKSRIFIIIGIVIGILSIGFFSYYISLSKFSSTSTKTSDTKSIKNKVIPSDTATNKTSRPKEKTTTTTNNTSTNKISSPDYYIFSKSGTENLLESDVSTLSKGNLALARNEIFARHGFVFKNEPFKSYFNNKSWYKVNPLFKGTDEELNSKELQNVKLILKYENK